MSHGNRLQRKVGNRKIRGVLTILTRLGVDGFVEGWLMGGRDSTSLQAEKLLVVMLEVALCENPEVRGKSRAAIGRAADIDALSLLVELCWRMT